MQGMTELMGASIAGAPIGVPGGGLVLTMALGQQGYELAAVFAQSPSVNATELAIKVVVVLGVTAGLLLVITHFLKKMGYGTHAPAAPKPTKAATRNNRRATSKTAPAISVEHIMPITRQAKVATINVDGHRLVVGITDQQVSLLKDLSLAADSSDAGTNSDRTSTGTPASEPVTGELERYPIDLAVIRAAQLRSRRAD